MTDRAGVLDASALLAYLQAEPGAERVRDALEIGCSMSTVNWSEVLSKMADLGRPASELTNELTDRGILHQCLRLEPFDGEDAARVGDLRPTTRHLGLSLGDRACLALAIRHSRRVLTSDRDWSDLDLDVEIELIR